MIASVVTGMAAACRAAGCALLGGETAEMPGVYQTGEFDVAGTIVGVVDRLRILPRVTNSQQAMSSMACDLPSRTPTATRSSARFSRHLT
jgi:phosphoribosylaminoimidazole (AIR) synthetase